MIDHRFRESILGTVRFIVLLFVSCISAFPLLWAISTSLKLPQYVVTFPPSIIPSPVVLENYKNVVLYTPFFKFLLNTFIVVFATIVISIILGSHAGYFISRFRVAGKGFIFLILSIGMMMQSVAILVPLYLLSKQLGIHDTYLILVLAFSGLLIPQTVYFSKSFVDTIPPELEEAAMVEGCSRLRAYYLVTFPLMRPVLIAAAIAMFVYVWNDLLMTMMLISSTSMQLIQLGLYYYFSITTGIPWGEAMAFLILGILPILFVFLLSGKRIIRGLTAGGVKG